MSTLKVNKLRDTAGSADAIVLDPNGGAVLAGVTTVTSVKVGAAVTISESGIEASGIGITCANINGTQIGGRRNIIINGAMTVAQRGTSYTGADQYNTVDRFKTVHSGLNEDVTTAQADVASGTTPYTEGFRKSYKITNGNQTGGAGSNDLLGIDHKIEAQDIANSGWNYVSSSSNITISYWVKSSVAQNFYVRMLTKDGTSQRFAFETGSLSANTWTKITKIISGNSNLQFDNNNGTGFEFRFYLFAGTDRTNNSVTLNTWAAHDSSLNTPDQTSTFYTTNDATFEITGVQLEVGSQATAFEHRSFNEELELCRRYYQKSYNYSVTPGTATHNGAIINSAYGSSDYAGFSVQLPTRMRDTPTVTIYSTTTGATGKMNADSAVGDASVGYLGEKNFFAHRNNDGTGVGNNVFMRIQFQADSEL